MPLLKASLFFSKEGKEVRNQASETKLRSLPEDPHDGLADALEAKNPPVRGVVHLAGVPRHRIRGCGELD